MIALKPAPSAKKLSFGSLGFFFITSLSPGSTPKAIAGNESVIKLIHNIWVGNRGTGQKNNTDRKIAITSPRLQDNKNITDFLILLYIFLPSSMACTMVVKLSSVNIISLAPFETSVPVIPIATPISAFFKDGASFTPSPVIDTILSCALKAFTIFTLCSGDTLANTL